MNLAELDRLRRSLRRLARTRYPAFLFGGRLGAAEIPVFTYHDVDAGTLRGDLDYLARNGYRTLGLAEYKHGSQEGSAARGRRVLLTFDDARRSFWEVAYPILEERGARAALFVPTYWIAGGRFLGDAEPAETRDFMTWEEIARCERSYLIDVESHSHRHVLVQTSERLVGFASPAALARHDLFDWPLRREGAREVCGRPALGTPVYESAPLLSAPLRVLAPPAAAEACRRAVEAAGGSPFFERRDWAARLGRVHEAAVTRQGGAARMSATDFRRQVEAEVRDAFAVFERELGRRPRFFAYPWMLGSRASLETLARFRVEAAFGVALDFRRARLERMPLPVFCRYKSDWLRFLPGSGRRRLHDVVPRKIATFIRSQHLAH